MLIRCSSDNHHHHIITSFIQKGFWFYYWHPKRPKNWIDGLRDENGIWIFSMHFFPISLSLSPPTTLLNPRFFYFFFGKKENKTPKKIKILGLWIQYSLFVCFFLLCLLVKLRIVWFQPKCKAIKKRGELIMGGVFLWGFRVGKQRKVNGLCFSELFSFI